MEFLRRSSLLYSLSVGKLFLFLLGAIACSVPVNAYIASPRTLHSASSINSVNAATRKVRNGVGSSLELGEVSCSNQRQFFRLHSSLDDVDKSENASDESTSLTNAVSNATASSMGAEFGDVAPMRRKSSSASTAQFGDVVSIRRPSSSSSSPSLFEEADSQRIPSTKSGLSDVELLRQRRIRNIGVAILSVALAVGNYAYQWTHPVTPIQLLVNMERSSAPLSDVGKNSKPTVIDFWAPWCENCRYMAPTLFQIEESYKDKVNFVMVNGDDPTNWPLIEKLGVDAIPHLALVESDGTVDTALIGAVPKEWLSRDIDTLLDNARVKNDGGEEVGKRPLPYQMLDVFANRPESRKISNLDAVIDPARR